MRYRLCLPLVLVLAWSATAAAPAAAHDVGDRVADVVAPLLPSVVRILIWAPATANTPVGPDGVKPDRTQKFGSGFVIDPSGIIATNQHVIADAFSVMVHFADGTTMPGKVMAENEAVDLALVKVEPPQPLSAMRWGDSDKVRIGEPVIAMGNPLGVGLSVSVGVVSALNRNIDNGPLGNYIQTDASINHGNSGGPLVNMQGEVIGVDTSIVSNSSGSVGLGYAIPAEDAQFIIERFRKYGEVRGGWMGATLQDVIPNVAAALDLKQSTGALVSAVAPNGPAAKAGLEEGDIVLRVDDLPAEDARWVFRAIGKTPIGDTATLTVWRRGHIATMPVTVAAFPNTGLKTAPSVAAAATEPEHFGLHVLAATPELEAKYKLAADQPGVVVTDVDRNSAGDEAGIDPGNSIVRVMFDRVSTPEEFAQRIETARSTLPFVALLVRSGSDQRWVGFPTSKGR